MPTPRQTTNDCFTPKQQAFFATYAEYQDFVEKNPMPRLGYQPLSRQEFEYDAHLVKMRQLSMDASNLNLKAAVDAICYTHGIKKFDINNEVHRQLIIPNTVLHNAPQYLQHLSTKDYEDVIKKRLKIAHATDLFHEKSESYLETVLVAAAAKHHALHIAHTVIKNFFTEKPKQITEADVLSCQEYWETDESVALPKTYFDEAAKARALAIKTQSIERNIRSLSGSMQQTSTEVAQPTQLIPTDAPLTLQSTQPITTAPSQASSVLSDAFSETLVALIGESSSIDGFEREEAVTVLYAALQSQIANNASPSDIISTKTQLDLEKAKIFNERKQFDKAIHEAKYTVNIASSLATIFGNDQLAGQLAYSGHSAVTIGNALAGIAGMGLLATASPLELGATLLSGIAGLVGLFRKADSGPNLVEILMPMLHAISQQLSQLRAEMHERFNEVMDTLNNMQRTLLNSLMELSRETKLTQEMVLAVIAKIDHLQERQDAGFLRLYRRFDQLELQIENAAARNAWKALVDLKPIAQAKDAANYNVNIKRLLTGYDAMGAYDPLLTGKPDRANTNDLQMPAFMLAQTLASAAKFYSPIGNPFAILYTTTLLGRFIEVHHKTPRDTYEGMTKEDAALLQVIDEKHIQPLRRLIIALRQMPVWDTLMTRYTESAACFERECASHLQKAIASHIMTENLRLQSVFSMKQLQQPSDHDIFMRQEIPIEEGCYAWKDVYDYKHYYKDNLITHNHTEVSESASLNSRKKNYREKLAAEVQKIKANHQRDRVFMHSINESFLLHLPLPDHCLEAISDKIRYLCAKKNFNIQFLYEYNETKPELTIMGRLSSNEGVACSFFKKTISTSPLHYKGIEALWWLWMGGEVPVNATIQGIYHQNSSRFDRRDCWYTKSFTHEPIFGRLSPLRDQINFSHPADQIPLSEEIERIYAESIEQELLQSTAYHTSLRSDVDDSATSLGESFENLNRAYLIMQRTLEFLEVVSPCDIWQSNLLHELNALLSAEKILSEARRQQVNPTCLLPREPMLAHFRETVRIEMQKQHNNSTLFFDDTLKEFFDIVEKCASTAQEVMSVQELKEFDDAVMNGIAMMVAEMSAGRMTAQQFAAFQTAHLPNIQAVRSGQMAVTPTLISSLRTPQIMAPSVVSSAGFFQPAATIPPTHTGNVATSSATPL